MIWDSRWNRSSHGKVRRLDVKETELNNKLKKVTATALITDTKKNHEYL